MSAVKGRLHGWAWEAPARVENHGEYRVGPGGRLRATIPALVRLASLSRGFCAMVAVAHARGGVGAARARWSHLFRGVQCFRTSDPRAQRVPISPDLWLSM